MIISYIKLGIASVFPIIATILVRLIQKNKKAKQAPKWLEQLLIGILFGGIAIVGTEWGIPLDGAMVNCRDAAPMVAGLVFGLPAGVIAGLIGGIERWIAVAWGVGSYTRLACSVSTIIAGFYSGLLRKFTFEDHHPTWPMGFACGVVMEVFHLSMVFITHMDDSVRAMQVVKACSIPMITANALALMFSIMVVIIMDHETIRVKAENFTVTEIVQRIMLFAVVIIFIATNAYSVTLNHLMAKQQADNLISATLKDVRQDVSDLSNSNLIKLTREAKKDYEEGKSLAKIAQDRDLADICIVSRFGIIEDSLDPQFIRFNMNSGAQSREFLVLNHGENEYVQEYGPISFDANIYRKYAGVAMDSGFIQVGLDADHFQREIASDIRTVAKNRHLGEDGYLIITDRTNSIVSAPSTSVQAAIMTMMSRSGLDGISGTEMTRITVEGTDMFTKSINVEGFNLMAFYPVSEAYAARNVSFYANAFMYVLMFAIMFLIIFNIIKAVIVKQLRSVGKSLGEISNGNLDVVVNSRGASEFSDLSDDINRTVDTMKGFIADAAARIDEDLATAKTIQESVLPNVYSKRKDYDAYARMDTAKEVGGDFYDFYHTHKDVVNILIADVSGKGIPAAMFMMRGKTELKSLTESEISVSEVFEKSNTALCEGNGNGMFITAWQGQIDLKTGLVQYANAGHNPPVIMHAGGDFEYLKSKVNLVLAGMEGVPYKLQELQLSKGDIIFLYTDGVTEATDANNQLYGEDRLLACLNANKERSVKEICDNVKEDVDKFVNGAPQFDDITMLAFKYQGKPESPKISFDEAKLEDIPEITEFIESKLEAMGCPMKAIIQINIAVDELYSNIVKYGYENTVGPASVIITENDDPHGVTINFVDQGVPYNPIKAEDPDITLGVEDREVGGLGIYMVKKSMDEMSYEYKNGRNILKITKNF